MSEARVCVLEMFIVRSIVLLFVDKYPSLRSFVPGDPTT